MAALTPVAFAISPNTHTRAGTHYVFQKEPSLPNNGIVILIEVDGTPVLSNITVSDDKSNTWVGGASFNDTGNGTQAKFFFCLAPATGTSRIDVSFGGASSQFISGFHVEFAGLASSGSSVNSAGATVAGPGNLQPGSFTPTNTGDLVIQWAHDASASPAVGITSWTKGSGFKKLSADRIDGTIAQWRTAPGGAINPIATVGGSSNSFLTIAMSLPADAARGTLPTGAYVRSVHGFGIDGSSTSFVIDVPCDGGNAIVVLSDMFRTAAPGTVNITSITDNKNAGGMSQAGSAVTNTLLGQSQGFYRANATTDDELLLTVNLDRAQDAGSTVVAYEVVNAGAFDTFADATGNQVSAGNVTGAPLITPASPGCVVIGHVSINNHTISGTVDPLISDAMTTPEEDGASSPGYQDNGYGHRYAVSGAQISFDWTVQNNIGGVGTWAAKAISLLPQSGGGGNTLMGQAML